MERVFLLWCRRSQASEQRPHPLPSSVNEITIPNEYALKNDGSQFLVYDSSANSAGRILIFCSPQMGDVLKTSTQWVVDGTFKVAPEVFFQVYTVHCCVHGSVLPAAYILTTRKTERTYTQAFEALNRHCNGL